MLTLENVIPKNLFAVKGDVKLKEGSSTADLDEAPPVNIIQRDQAMYVHFSWKQYGWLGKLICNSSWILRVYIEQIGLGEVNNPPAVTVPFQQSANSNYHGLVTLPANSLPVGAFRIVATLTLRGPKGPTPIAAFEDLGIIQVYED